MATATATFEKRPWLDLRTVNLLTVIGLYTLCISALIMWLRRRPDGVLGAPVPIRKVRFSAGLVAAMIAFGVYFPFLGGSMILVALAERFLLSRIPATKRWPVLYGAQAAA